MRADCVVIATGYATPEFKPLAGRFRMMNTYVVATEPIRAAASAALGLGDVMLWNTERPYHYGRWTRDHRLVIGGADRPRVAGRGRRRALREGAREVREYFDGLYPALANVSTAAASVLPIFDCSHSVGIVEQPWCRGTVRTTRRILRMPA